MIEKKSDGRSAERYPERSFYPLTLPLTVGPGSISIAITLGANEPRHLGANLLALSAAAIGSAFVALTIYRCYGFADRLAAVMGPTGMNVIVKLSSFFLVCIGVQIVWNGVSQLLASALQAAVPAISRSRSWAPAQLNIFVAASFLFSHDW